MNFKENTQNIINDIFSAGLISISTVSLVIITHKIFDFFFKIKKNDNIDNIDLLEESSKKYEFCDSLPNSCILRSAIINRIEYSYLDLIFSADDDLLTKNHNFLLVNKGFFEILKFIYNDKNNFDYLINSEEDTIFKQELMIFLRGLLNCNSLEDFQSLNPSN